MNQFKEVPQMEPSDEITELLPAELIQFPSTSKEVSPPPASGPDSYSVPEEAPLAEEDEEPTVIEFNDNPQTPSKKQTRWEQFIDFMLSPDYTPTIPIKIKGYFRQVRQRIIASREIHRANYPNTFDEKLIRLFRRVYLRLKTNLLEKYE